MNTPQYILSIRCGVCDKSGCFETETLVFILVLTIAYDSQLLVEVKPILKRIIVFSVVKS